MDHLKITDGLGVVRNNYYFSREILSNNYATFNLKNHCIHVYKEYRGFTKHPFTHSEIKSLVKIIIFQSLGFKISNLDEYLKNSQILDNAQYTYTVKSKNYSLLSSFDGYTVGPAVERVSKQKKYNWLPAKTIGVGTPHISLMDMIETIDAYGERLGCLFSNPIKTLYGEYKAFSDMYNINKNYDEFKRNCTPSVYDYLISNSIFAYLLSLIS